MRAPSTLVSVAVAAALALLAAGCGGGSGGPGVANVATSTSPAASAQTGLVAFADCMRSSGVAQFPDPDSSGGIPKPLVVAALHANPNKFKSAQATCSHLLPSGSLAAPLTSQQIRVRVADGLSFANCMRGHGLARFPDPTAQGELSIEMVQSQGIDVHSPAFLQAVRTCLPASHRALTPAKVEQALNGGRG
jgi:hypothetical protein